MAAAIDFRDSGEVRWTVREEGRDDILARSSEPAVTWLTFETELEVRRLWSYPDDWARLGPAQLEALCRRANTVIARFPRNGYRTHGMSDDRGRNRVA